MSTRTLSAERAVDLVHDATTAPSVRNARPWRFRCLRGERTFEIRADSERALRHADPDARGLHIGCGAAVLNLRVAAAHAGWRPEARLLPDPRDPTLLVTVHLADPDGGESDLAALYPAVHRRHTGRLPYAGKPIPTSVRSALAYAARREGALLEFPGPGHLGRVPEPIEEAESRDRAGTRRIPGRESADFERAPRLALLSTLRDHPEDWLRAGQAMERVLLLATSEGLVGAPVARALEWPDPRRPPRDPVSGKGRVQMVLRLGYGPSGPRTPRRPLPDVLDIDP